MFRELEPVAVRDGAIELALSPRSLLTLTTLDVVAGALRP